MASTSQLVQVKWLKPNYSFLGLFDSIFSTGYRAYADTPNAHPMQNVDLINIEGRLVASQFDVKKPTVILAAHYDAGGAIPVNKLEIVYAI